MRSSLAAINSGVDMEVDVIASLLGSIESAGSWRNVIRWRILKVLDSKDRNAREERLRLTAAGAE